MKCSSGKKTLFKILTCALGAGVSLVFLLFILGGGFMKQTYLEPWNRDYASHMADPRVRLAAAGLLAANNHNMQPWKVKLDQEDAMILSRDNSRTDQVRSGMLYSRLVLTGHTLDLTMQPLSQVLEEYPEMKQTYENFNHEYASRGQTVQMLLRIGKPVKPAPYSMRRDVLSLIKE